MVKKILPFLTLLFVVVTVVAVIMIVGEVKDRQQEIDDFNELADLIADFTVPDESENVTEPENRETEATEPKAPTPVFTRNLTPLFEKNADCIGWVYIESTAVDYPVMRTPSEPQRYLRLNFDKEYSIAGVPFLKNKCTMDSTEPNAPPGEIKINIQNKSDSTLVGNSCESVFAFLCENCRIRFKKNIGSNEHGIL
jgi:sortase B